MAMVEALAGNTPTLEDMKLRARAAFAAHPGLDIAMIELPPKFQDRALTICWTSDDESKRLASCTGLVQTWLLRGGAFTGWAPDVVAMAVAAARRGLDTVPGFDVQLKRTLGVPT